MCSRTCRASEEYPVASSSRIRSCLGDASIITADPEDVEERGASSVRLPGEFSLCYERE